MPFNSCPPTWPANKVHVAVITETHLKKKRDYQLFSVDGYTMFRRDRAGRRGGGVAVYVNSRLQATTCHNDVSDYERVGASTIIIKR